MPQKPKTNKRRPIIALLTDFGVRDWFVASMKGVIKGIAPASEIIDIAHEVEPHNIASASFILQSCFRDFPEGTVFCAVVDPGVGSARRRLAATDGAYFFVAPDNGLLCGVEAVSESFLVYSITKTGIMRKGTGTTFEGRDVFAPAAAHLATGMPIETLGPLCKDMNRLDLYTAGRDLQGKLKGRVVYIDRFGNLLTNIMPDDLPEDVSPSSIVISIKGRRIRGLHESYASVKPGALVAYWCSTGHLEIAVNCGSATKILSARKGDVITLSIRV